MMNGKERTAKGIERRKQERERKKRFKKTVKALVMWFVGYLMVTGQILLVENINLGESLFAFFIKMVIVVSFDFIVAIHILHATEADIKGGNLNGRD